MSWSTSSTVIPPSRMLAAGRRARALSEVSRPAAGSSMHSIRGRAATARAAPTSLRWPALSSFGHPPGELGNAEDVEGVGDVVTVAAGRVEQIGHEPAERLTFGGDARLSTTVRSSNSSSDCQVRPSPARAR